MKIWLKECFHDGMITTSLSCKFCEENKEHCFDKSACKTIGFIEIDPVQKSYLPFIIEKINQGDPEWWENVKFTKSYINSELEKIFGGGYKAWKD